MMRFKLFYYNARGRAEVTRLLFAYRGQNFEDVRINEKDWPTYKSLMPVGHIPVLEVQPLGVRIPQSIAIARFVAKELDLAGCTNLEQAKVDSCIDTIADIIHRFWNITFAQDESLKKNRLNKFFIHELPKGFQNLEKLMTLYGNGRGPFFFGDRLLWPDLFFQDCITNLYAEQTEVLRNYPKLKNNCEAVEQEPNIAIYLKNRPITPF